MALYKYGSSSRSTPSYHHRTEFEILKESHKFLRDEDKKDASWDDQLARKYYESLYREFAVCDLKHYKSGNFSLRWRTESEVLSGAGEMSCGNTRCVHHPPPRDPDKPDDRIPPLTTLELPFTYIEHEETKSALVKVVLCERCCKKLMWKRRKGKEETERQGSNTKSQNAEDAVDGRDTEFRSIADAGLSVDKESQRREVRGAGDGRRRRRSSRSRSPVRRDK